MIEFKNVTYQYELNDFTALKDVSLNIPKGWVSILGHNGSGKSTLVKLLMGVFEKYNGEIFYKGSKITENNSKDIRKNFAIVFQNPDNQFVGATVEDDVAFGLENHGISREIMVQRVNDALHAVNMSAFKSHEPSRLSGGQKQRVAIAGALALHPEVLILDEATSMLDPKGRHEIIEILKNIQKETDTTIIYITHDLTEIDNSDYVCVMKDGQIMLKGSIETIYQHPNILKESHLILPYTMQLSHALLDGTYMSYHTLVNRL